MKTKNVWMLDSINNLTTINFTTSAKTEMLSMFTESEVGLLLYFFTLKCICH